MRGAQLAVGACGPSAPRGLKRWRWGQARRGRRRASGRGRAGVRDAESWAARLGRASASRGAGPDTGVWAGTGELGWRVMRGKSRTGPWERVGLRGEGVGCL